MSQPYNNLSPHHRDAPMMYTKEQMIYAYTAGFLKAVDRGTFSSPAFARDMAFAYAEEYVADRFSKSGPDAPSVAGNASRNDQAASPHLPTQRNAGRSPRTDSSELHVPRLRGIHRHREPADVVYRGLVLDDDGRPTHSLSDPWGVRGCSGGGDSIMSRGYYGVVAFHPKTEQNVGTLFRSSFCFGAAFCGTVGRRYHAQASDTQKASRHVPTFHFPDAGDLWAHIPLGCVPIAVEITDDARDLCAFVHPNSAVYILGPEDGSVPTAVLSKCKHVLQIPSTLCLNLAVAGSIVMYDRVAKRRASHV